ncbi:hypothetical protein EV361DRAFT_607907 [Lentinula raphanica]|nr:hypothetical protein F5880DRAFT_175941 [Lentinula raphanica]KAJ3965973.1 hypothetical protein EV361DRAFT_607907 [Lentinula raphanica]
MLSYIPFCRSIMINLVILSLLHRLLLRDTSKIQSTRDLKIATGEVVTVTKLSCSWGLLENDIFWWGNECREDCIVPIHTTLAI